MKIIWLLVIIVLCTSCFNYRRNAELADSSSEEIEKLLKNTLLAEYEILMKGEDFPNQLPPSIILGDEKISGKEYYNRRINQHNQLKTKNASYKQITPVLSDINIKIVNDIELICTAKEHVTMIMEFEDTPGELFTTKETKDHEFTLSKDKKNIWSIVNHTYIHPFYMPKKNSDSQYSFENHPKIEN